MTRTCVAAVLAALAVSPLAAQTAPSSRYKLQGPAKAESQSAGQRQVLGPVAAPRPARTTTDGNVRPAGDTQPIREPGAGQLPPRQPLRGAGPPLQPRVDGPPQQPVWFPLAAEMQKWVDDVLIEWEKTSSAVHYFECSFQRWEFEPVFGPKDGKTPKSYATGVIKYQDPDKGLFRVDSLKNYVAPAQPGEKPKFVTPKDEYGEHWVCDGTNIFEFDNRQKKLIKRILPVQMQGKAIADGPLPFLFGAKAATIKQRYWIRPVPETDKPPGHDDEYWLEAWPKSRQDAANFKFVKIVIAEKDFMPSALSVYMPNFDAKKNPAHIDYQFDNRKARLKNDKSITPGDLLFWRKQFFQPNLPFGWKEETQNLNPPVAAGPQPAPPPQAQRLKTGVKTK
ncbi:MAG TPA: TIGR03009 domain-containing protein [Pirellulaceae bacterium]|nr:TIGR03009 domain-containing protein [Pirellulaceae bacterium]